MRGPRGKTTQIAAKLNGTGLIWSNEYVRSRAQILISNIERMGIRNAVVSSSRPDALAQKLPAYFDKVLVDAPCSGEGMFRKNPLALSEWSVEHTVSCGVRQLNILESAAHCLKPGGILVYSTCTFAPEENEKLIEAFLEKHPEFTLEDIDVNFGTKSYLKNQKGATLRIYPMDGGEGHFVAKLRKIDGDCISLPEYVFSKPNQYSALFEKEYAEISKFPFTEKPT